LIRPFGADGYNFHRYKPLSNVLLPDELDSEEVSLGTDVSLLHFFWRWNKIVRLSFFLVAGVFFTQRLTIRDADANTFGRNKFDSSLGIPKKSRTSLFL
jgi:hypothetical protein